MHTPLVMDLDPVLRPVVETLWHQPTAPVCNERLHLFADGAAFFPRDCKCTVAAAAVVQAIPGQARLIPCISSMLPGQEQSIFRAELYAGTLALSRSCVCSIYTDNAAFCQSAQFKLDTARSREACSQWEHLDVWALWHEQLSLCDHQEARVIKVKSHRDPGAQVSSFEAWAAVHNNHADHRAKMTVMETHPGLLKSLQKQVDEQSAARKKFEQLHDFLVL